MTLPRPALSSSRHRYSRPRCTKTPQELGEFNVLIAAQKCVAPFTGTPRNSSNSRREIIGRHRLLAARRPSGPTCVFALRKGPRRICLNPRVSSTSLKLNHGVARQHESERARGASHLHRKQRRPVKNEEPWFLGRVRKAQDGHPLWRVEERPKFKVPIPVDFNRFARKGSNPTRT
jgi:hypothetical protein